MKKRITGWILCATLAGGGIAWAGPQASVTAPSADALPGYDDDLQLVATAGQTPRDPALSAPFASTFADLAPAGAASDFDLLSSGGGFDLAAGPAASAASAVTLSGDQHPMIPLPPGLWAGLITLGCVAYHTVRQQRSPAGRRR